MDGREDNSTGERRAAERGHPSPLQPQGAAPGVLHHGGSVGQVFLHKVSLVPARSSCRLQLLRGRYPDTELLPESRRFSDAGAAS